AARIDPANRLMVADSTGAIMAGEAMGRVSGLPEGALVVHAHAGGWIYAVRRDGRWVFVNHSDQGLRLSEAGLDDSIHYSAYHVSCSAGACYASSAVPPFTSLRFSSAGGDRIAQPSGSDLNLDSRWVALPLIPLDVGYMQTLAHLGS